jgi:hypothetical protein
MSERITIHYIYLLIEREFIKSGESIYKIGRSKRSHKKTTLLTQRICEYPKGSKCILCRIVNNCYTAEATIKKIFGQKFINRPDIGTEYFEGNIEQMKLEFIKIADEYSVLYEDINEDIDDYSIFMFNKKSNLDIDNLENKESVKNVLNNDIEKIPKKVNCFCCKKCNAIFKAKGDYNRHINKKIPCDKEERELYDIQKRTCIYCSFISADICCSTRHMKICKFIPSETEQLKQIIAQLNNTISQQNNKINIQNDKISNITCKMEEINTIQKCML